MKEPPKAGDVLFELDPEAAADAALQRLQQNAASARP
jgi:multidrug resistance efflux pump